MAAILAPPEVAVQKWYTDSKSTRLLTPDIVCLHTMVGTLAGSYSWANQDGNPYWHFGVNGKGDAWQCWDLRFRTAANLEGNWHVIPIETADRNEGIWPLVWSDPLWTPQQMVRLSILVAWLCRRFNIPAVLIPDTKPGRRGIAYHRQGIPGNPEYVTGGEVWSLHKGKTCPAKRASQVAQLIRMVQQINAPSTPPTGDWLDMATKAEVAALLKTYTSGWLVRPKMPDGSISPHVFVVASDFTTKTWWGNWDDLKVLDFLEDLNDAGKNADGSPKPHNFAWDDGIGQIHELWNPQLGTSMEPLPVAQRWKNTPEPRS